MNTRQRILSFIQQYRDKNGRSPTQQEIAEAIGRRQSSVNEALDLLIKLGYLEKEPNVPRSLVVRWRLTGKK